jgi:hypothetical protein
MKKFLSFLIGFILLTSTAIAASPAPQRSYWYRDGDTLKTKPNTLNVSIGGTLSVTGITLTGDLDMSGNDVDNIGNISGNSAPIGVENNLFLGDDIQLEFGNAAGSADATLEWDTAGSPDAWRFISAGNIEMNPTGFLDVNRTITADSQGAVTIDMTSGGDYANNTGLTTTLTTGGMLTGGDFTYGQRVLLNSNASDASGTFIVGDAIINNNASGGANAIYGYVSDFAGQLGTAPTNTGDYKSFVSIISTSVAAGDLIGYEAGVTNDTAAASGLWGAKLVIYPNVAGITDTVGVSMTNSGSQTADEGYVLGGTWTKGLDFSNATLTTDIDLSGNGVINNSAGNIQLVASGVIDVQDRAEFANGYIIADGWNSALGTSSNLKRRWDTNSGGDDLAVFQSVIGAGDTEAILFSNGDPDGMTDHDNYLSPTPVFTNTLGADTGDYSGVVMGWRTQNDVGVTNYYDFYAMTGALDGAVDGTITELAAIFRFGDNPAATTHSLGAGDVVFNDDAEFDGTAYYDGNIIYTPSGDQSLLAASQLTVTNQIMRVVGNGGAVTLTSTPHIVDSTDGDCIIIQGTSNANTVTFQDESNLANSGMQLAGATDMTLGQGDTLQVCYDLGDDDWYEISRSDNN